MTKDEMNEAWRLIGAYKRGDKRMKDQELLRAWYLALAPYQLADVKEAIISHFRESGFWPDVAEIVRKLPEIPGAGREKRENVDPGFARQARWVREFHDRLYSALRAYNLPTSEEAKQEGVTFPAWHKMLEANGIDTGDLLVEAWKASEQEPAAPAV